MTNNVIKWTARFLAGTGILVCGFALAGLVGGPPAPQRPFMLPGAPFGTDAQNTQLGLFTLGAGFALALVIASQDTTRPDGLTGVGMGMLIFVLPPLVTASLLRLHSRNDALQARR